MLIINNKQLQLPHACQRGVITEYIKPLGKGAYGEAHLITYEEKPVVLKVFREGAELQPLRNNAKDLLRRKNPSPRRLAYPVDGIAHREGGLAGYVMEYIPHDVFHTVLDCLRPSVEVAGASKEISLWARCRTAANFAALLQQVHGSGWVYGDISSTNLLMHPRTGEVRAIDPDNLRPQGNEHRGKRLKLPYVYTYPYGDPFVLQNGGGTSVESDRHSLAVLLFHLLCWDSPFAGRMTNVVLTDDKLDEFSRRPIFSFDPENDQNRATPEAAPAACILWPMLPRFVQEKFSQTFTAGLNDPSARVRDSSWRDVMTRLADLVTCCSGCGCEYYAAPLENLFSEKLKCPNPRCKDWEPPLRLYRQGTLDLTLHPGQRLCVGHLDSDRNKFDKAIGEVTSARDSPGQLALRNRSSHEWIVEQPGGKATRLVSRNQCVRLAPGMVLTVRNVVLQVIAKTPTFSLAGSNEKTPSQGCITL